MYYAVVASSTSVDFSSLRLSGDKLALDSVHSLIFLLVS